MGRGSSICGLRKQIFANAKVLYNEKDFEIVTLYSLNGGDFTAKLVSSDMSKVYATSNGTYKQASDAILELLYYVSHKLSESFDKIHSVAEPKRGVETAVSKAPPADPVDFSSATRNLQRVPAMRDMQHLLSPRGMELLRLKQARQANGSRGAKEASQFLAEEEEEVDEAWFHVSN